MFDKPIRFLFATGCRFAIHVDVATLHPCCSQKLHLLQVGMDDDGTGCSTQHVQHVHHGLMHRFGTTIIVASVVYELTTCWQDHLVNDRVDKHLKSKLFDGF